jgi:hypothetical protein
MKVGIIGAGSVGGTLGRGLRAAGHEVTYGVREPGDGKYDSLAEDGAAVVALGEVAAGADAVILATPWAAAQAALEAAGDLGGVPLLDATNPIGPGFVLTPERGDSGGEQVARWAPTARVVKIFNTTGANNMAAPGYPGGAAAMPYCGDDDAACQVAHALAEALGFEPARVGGLSESSLLEHMAMLWIRLAMQQGRDFAFGFLRRQER